jgi:hypothetical protein
VAAWRRSGLSQRAYSEQQGLVKGTLGCWASKLGRETAERNELVEIGRAEALAERPIEVVVGGRYVVRLWRGTDRDHVQEVLTLLEQRR